MGKTCGTTEIAEIFGVVRRTVTSWKAAGCPVKKGGGRGKEDVYDSAEVHQWLLSEAVGDGRERDPEIKKARLEILRTEGDLRRLRLREREHEVISTADVEDIMGEAFGAIRMGFTGFVPYLYNEVVLQKGPRDVREAYTSISARMDTVLFSVYVGLARSFGNLVGRGDRKALKIASEAWQRSFGGRWEEELDRILDDPPIPKGGL